MNLTQLLNGIALGSLLMVLSSGMAIVFGLRGVMNFAQGGLYMVGAYTAYTVSVHMSFWLALVVVPLGLAVVGIALEMFVFRPLDSRAHLEAVLLTLGIAMVIDQVVIAIWGSDTVAASPPAGFQGEFSLFGLHYPAYRLLVIVAAAIVAIALTTWLRLTRTGLHIRACSHDAQTASILGVNRDHVSLIVVCVSTGLAGVAGTLAAPLQAINPGIGMANLVIVLIVVIVGGVGSIPGAMVAGLGIGIIQTIGTVLFPSVSSLIPYAVLVVVLLVRPAGIAGRSLA